MKLNFRTLGEGKPLIILHGLFGSIDNWHTLARSFAEHFKVYLVELRNHGKSPHSNHFNYGVMVGDLIELFDEVGLNKVDLLGHSMGGKAAMNLACVHPHRVNHLIVVDIAPRAYPPHHQEIFDGFERLNLKIINSRLQADEMLARSVPDKNTRLFLLKNLARNHDGSFSWRLNIPGIRKNIDRILEELPSDFDFDGPTLFIGGSNSKYILEEDISLIRYHFPQAEVKYIEGAGHWVHAEKPAELHRLVWDFLLESA